MTREELEQNLINSGWIKFDRCDYFEKDQELFGGMRKTRIKLEQQYVRYMFMSYGCSWVQIVMLPYNECSIMGDDVYFGDIGVK